MLTLGFGIAVATSVFLVVNAALLRPLPYERPEQLVELGHVYQRDEGPSVFSGVTWREVGFWRSQSHVFAGVEAYEVVTPPMAWREQGRELRRGRVTSGMPALLGIEPIVGRGFSAEETDREIPVLLISEHFWETEFDRRTSAVGSVMTLDNVSFTVIGVMPSTFRYGPAGGGRVEVWTGLPERGTSTRPDNDVTMILCRLQESVDIETGAAMAATAVAPIAEALTPDLPGLRGPWVPRLSTLADWRSRTSRQYTMSPLLLLLCTSGMLLIIACANVANLLIGRGLGRRGELRTRAALGASRGSIVRLLMLEGAVLTTGAAALGVACSAFSIPLVLSMMPAGLLTMLFEVGAPVFDWRVAAFVVLVSTCTALLASLWPAVRLSGAPLTNSPETGSTRQSTTRVLQVAQVALALVMAVGAGLMVRASVPPDFGFDADRLGDVMITLPQLPYDSAASQMLGAALVREMVGAIPSVEAATIGRAPNRFTSFRFYEIEGQPPVQGTRLAARTAVAPDYFDAVGMRMLEGRPFNSADVLNGAPVVIIDHAARQLLFGDGPAVGQRFRVRSSDPYSTVIGVVSDAATTEILSAGPLPGLYTPWSQHPARTFALTVRTDRDVSLEMAEVGRRIVAAIPDAMVTSSMPVAQAFERAETYARPRFAAMLAALFASLALLTSAVGLSSQLAFSVRQRQREIAVRVALGASQSNVTGLVLSQALAVVIPGLLVGGAIATIAIRRLSSVVYVADISHLPAFAAGACLMILATIAATAGPARRAARVDPIEALKRD